MYFAGNYRLGYTTIMRPVSYHMCGLALFSVALLNLYSERSIAGESNIAPRIMVNMVLLEAPSLLDMTSDLSTLGTKIDDPSMISVGQKIYAEVWCQTDDESRVSSAVIDLTYDATFLSTTIEQIALSGNWGLLSFPITVDDEAGIIENIGGNNFTGHGTSPEWARIVTVEFDVLQQPISNLALCSLYAGLSDGGAPLEFALRGIGSIPPEEVFYGCSGMGCYCPESLLLLRDLALIIDCFNGPSGILSFSCFCKDTNNDSRIDLIDYAKYLRVHSFSP